MIVWDDHLEADYEDRQSQTGFLSEHFPDPDEDGEDDPYEAICPACGEYISYCQGHGMMDPEGSRILHMHDLDDHSRCAEGSDCRA